MTWGFESLHPHTINKPPVTIFNSVFWRFFNYAINNNKMNITKENIDDLNAVLKVKIGKSDYEESVETVLKDYRKKSFRNYFLTPKKSRDIYPIILYFLLKIFTRK